MTLYIIIGIALILLLFSGCTKKHEAFGNIGEVVSLWNKGYALKGGLRATTRQVASKGALVVGPSGSGKTSTVLLATLNSIARGKSSCVVLDVSGEIHSLMSGYLSRKYHIYCINFSDTSDGYNPLAVCKNVSDIQKVAHILIKNSGIESKGDPYWSASAEKMISIFIQYILNYTEPEYHTLLNVVRMIEVFAGEPQKVDVCFARTDETLLSAYKAAIAVGEKTLQSTISSALVALKLFTNPDVARCSGISTFDFHNFRTEKSMLFLNIPVTNVNFYAPYSALIYQQLFDVVLSKIPADDAHHIYALIDEMPSMRFENLGLVYSNIRKYKGAILGVVQDERMLEMCVPPAEAHAIRTNSYSKIYLPGQPHQTCKILEDIIGKDITGKSVMSASQIRMAQEAIIIVGNKKPYLEKMIPFYDHWLLSKRTQYPPYEQTRKIPFDTPPLLKL